MPDKCSRLRLVSNHPRRWRRASARVESRRINDALGELIEALDLIEQLRDGGCSHAITRARNPTLSCAEFRTWQQGAPMPACLNCRAKEFLARFGRRVD